MFFQLSSRGRDGGTARDAFFTKSESMTTPKFDPGLRERMKEREAEKMEREKAARDATSHEAPASKAPKEIEGYVGFANLPNQVYRKSVKRGFEFTLMVVGKISGK